MRCGVDASPAGIPGIPAMSFLAGAGPADLLAAGLAGLIPGMASIAAGAVPGSVGVVTVGAASFDVGAAFGIPGIASISCLALAAAADSGVAVGVDFFGAGVDFGAMPGMSFMSVCAHAALG